MKITLLLKNLKKIFENKFKYVIIENGDFMKNIFYINIQDEIKNNHDITNIISEVFGYMKINYPDYLEWFNNKLLTGLSTNERNIIVAYKNNQLIGFVNLKKTNKEQKMSNLYIKQSIYYKKIWKEMIKLSLKWLEVPNPTIIISNQEIKKCVGLIMDMKWMPTDIKNNDIIFNGNNNEFMSIEKSLRKRMKNKSA